MKHLVVVSFLAILVLMIFLSFTQSTNEYEYLTIDQGTFDLVISKSDDFESMNIRHEKGNSDSDFRPILLRVEKYEREGWEIVANNVYATSTPIKSRNYFLLRRKKQSTGTND